MERDPFHLVRRAWAAYEAKHYDLAEREAHGALAVEPNDPEALSVLSLCAMERKNRALAVRLAERSISSAPDAPIFHYRLALVHARFGDHKAAEPALQNTLALNPEFAPAYSLYAWVYYARGHIKIALSAVDEALKFDPYESYAINLRIELLQASHDYDGARHAANEALAINPENDHAHAMAGMLALKSRNRRRSVSHLSEAVRINPRADWVRKAFVQALESQHGFTRWLLKLQHWTASSLDGHGAFWLLLWAAYLTARWHAGVPLDWTLPPAAVAGTFLVLLVVAWWGGLASYFLLRSRPDVQRLIAAENTVPARMRIATPGQIAMSASILLTLAAYFVPGQFVVALASGVLFNGISLLCCDAAKSRRAVIATRIYAVFIFIASIAWVSNLAGSAHFDPERGNPVGSVPFLAAFSYLVLTYFETDNE